MEEVIGMSGLLLLSSSFPRIASRARNCFNLIKTRHSHIKTLYVSIWANCLKSGQASQAGPGQGHAINYGLLRNICGILYSQSYTSLPPSVDLRILLQCPHDGSPPIQIYQKNKSHHRHIGLVLIEKELECEIFPGPGSPGQNQNHKVFLQKLLGDIKSPDCKLEIEEEQGQTDPVLGLGQQDMVIGSDTSASTRNDLGDQIFPCVALGGTFDKLHNGHKILLTEALTRAENELIVGVTDETMIKSKTLADLIEPCDIRMANVLDFLQDVQIPKERNLRVLSISDPFGPTITEENIQAIVVSEETNRGAVKINEIRAGKNYPPLSIHTIQMYTEQERQSSVEEDKISSSTKRIRILGERLRPPFKPSSSGPYIVGLTGGIASGKSSAASYLSTQGHVSIDCDKLGHEAYQSGTACIKSLTQVFGHDILHSNGEVNRKILGSKVFGKPEELHKLTAIVWPEIKRLAQERIDTLTSEGHKIIFLDAAVLLEAGWNSMCHDVWVFFVPTEEAIKRIIERDGIPQEAAEARLKSQMTNRERIAQATFVFSSLWEKEFTRAQIDKALGILKNNPALQSMTNKL